jgi:hypothetical protein
MLSPNLHHVGDLGVYYGAGKEIMFGAERPARIQMVAQYLLFIGYWHRRIWAKHLQY